MFEIRSKIEKDLLSYFFLNTHAKHHLHDLARILNLDPGNLDKKIKKLETTGLFTSETRGNQRIYSLNKDFPLFDEYKSIINKTYGIEELLKEVLKEVPGIKNAFIFGSYATNEFNKFSDIDILIVGSHNSLKLSEEISKVELQIGREINYVEYLPDEYEKKRKADPFLQKAVSNIIKLI